MNTSAWRIIARWFFALAVSIWSIGIVLPSLGGLWSPLGGSDIKVPLAR